MNRMMRKYLLGGVALLMVAGVLVLLFSGIFSGSGAADKDHQMRVQPVHTEDVAPPAPTHADAELTRESRESPKESPRLLLVAMGDIQLDRLRLIAVHSTDGFKVDLTVSAPGEVQLPTHGLWTFLVMGDSIVPHLGAVDFAEFAEERKSFFLLPLGSIEIRIDAAPRVGPFDEDEFGALLRFSNQLARFISSNVRGFPLASPFKIETARSELMIGVERIAGKGWMQDFGEEQVAVLREICNDRELVATLMRTSPNTNRVHQIPIASVAEPIGAQVIAANGYSWKLYSPQAFVVEPSPLSAQVSPDGVGFVKNMKDTWDWTWSKGFDVLPGETTVLKATVFGETLITGQLDLSVCSGPATGGKVRFFHVLNEQDATGMTLRRNEVEGIVRARLDNGFFEFKNALPGPKRITATWQDDRGNHFIVNRFFELQSEDVVDLGLLRPSTGPPVTFLIDLTDDDGNLVPWHRLFGADSEPGLTTLTIASKERMIQPNDDVWDVFYPRIGDRLTVHGLAAGRWRCNLYLGGLDEGWPEPIVPMQAFESLDPLYFENWSPTQVKVPVRIQVGSPCTLRLALPVAAVAARSPVIKVWLYDFDSDTSESKSVMRKNQGSRDIESELFLPPGKCFLVVRVKDAVQRYWGQLELPPVAERNDGPISIPLVFAVEASGSLSDELRERARSGVLQFWLSGWPSMEKTPLVANINEQGGFRLDCVPRDSDLFEIRLDFQVNSGKGDLGLIE